MKKKLIVPISTACAMLLLIIDGKTALSGATDGILLCLQSLIPSLFPFFILSTMLTSSIAGIPIRFLNPIAKLCRIPFSCTSLLAVGFLGGYPIGAQNVALMYRKGYLSDHQAKRMIVFCNNAGPSFLFGVLGSMFSEPKVLWFLWFVHIISALLVGFIIPGSDDARTGTPSQQQISLPAALEISVKTMALVCGWVIISRMALKFLQRWFLWLFPEWVQVLVTGILELSNGCIQLSNISCEGLRFTMAAAFLSLGGVCVSLQTASVSRDIPQNLYFPGKLLQCCFSVTACSILQFLFPSADRFTSPILFYGSIAVGIILILFFRYLKNCSRIPAQIGV